jgi:hypothetical protein
MPIEAPVITTTFPETLIWLELIFLIFPFCFAATLRPLRRQSFMRKVALKIHKAAKKTSPAEFRIPQGRRTI